MAAVNPTPFYHRLAVPAVVLLIAFLSYSSQYLLYYGENLDPGPPTDAEFIIFNLLVTCLWVSYYRTCTLDPGRFPFPLKSSSESSGKPSPPADNPATPAPAPGSAPDDGAVQDVTALLSRPGFRWCSKCRAPKPPRAHHCRHCQRCVPRMDHHCPWTSNCVSLVTFPHFLRFLAYANVSLWYLAYLLYQRFAALWDNRNWPAYLGPTLAGLIHLTVLSLVCFFTSLALLIMLVSTVKNWAVNMTMIEMWEQERHEAFVSRGDRDEWFDDLEDEDEDEGEGNAGRSFAQRIEFPYDVGLFRNMAQAMGTRNILLWPFPFAKGPAISTDDQGFGWTYEENGFNPREGMWPPPDPEKMRRKAAARRRRQNMWSQDNNLAYPAGGDGDPSKSPLFQDASSVPDMISAFRARQQADLARRQQHNQRQRDDILVELEELGSAPSVSDSGSISNDEDIENNTRNSIHAPRHRLARDTERGWKNSEGERLRDFGVDDDDDDDDDFDIGPVPVIVPAEDDDDVPLGELLRRRNAVKNSGLGE